MNKETESSDSHNLSIYKNKSVMVTGGAGSIGSEITKQLLKSKLKKLIVIDHSEFNIYRLNQKIEFKKNENNFRKYSGHSSD